MSKSYPSEWLLDRFIELYDNTGGRHTHGLAACAREAIKLGAREANDEADEAKATTVEAEERIRAVRARIRAIVDKVVEAERLAGGFRIYFDTAVNELLALVKKG